MAAAAELYYLWATILRSFCQRTSAMITGVPVSDVEVNQPFWVRMEYRITSNADRIFVPNFHFHCQDDSCAFITSAVNAKKLPPGEYSAECHVPANFLNDGLYSIRIALTSFKSGVSIHFDEKGAIMLSVRDPIEGIVTRAGYSGGDARCGQAIATVDFETY